MNKLFLSSFVAISFVAYGLFHHFNSSPASQAAALAAPAVAGAHTSDVKYKDGTYTGNIADAFYGNVQVQAVISGGKITGVNFMDYPHDRGHSVAINLLAMPILRSEAITAQSARVDAVSGATQTSRAFVESLTSALSQAS